MTPAEYLRARGWETEAPAGEVRWCKKRGGLYEAGPCGMDEAVALQVRLDRECAAFVATWKDEKR